MFLEHVNLTVADLDRSIAFYCDLLDLQVRWKGPIDDHRLGAHVGDEQHYLARLRSAACPRTRAQGASVQHLLGAKRKETPIRHRASGGDDLVHADSVLLGLAVE